MKKIILFLTLLTIILPLSLNAADSSYINTAHLNSLYEECNTGQRKIGIIHIYSGYPNYRWSDDDQEGIACLDDAARALVFSIHHYLLARDKSSLAKIKPLTEFLLYMQSPKGLFYNFVHKDMEINKKHSNSTDQFNWWTCRAFYGLTESYIFFENRGEHLYTARIKKALGRFYKASSLNIKRKNETVEIQGLQLPKWLPNSTASDQGAVIVMSLINYYKITHDKSLLGKLKQYCDGIIMMQKGKPDELPYCAFLSWENSWHAWGNNQAYALLKAYELVKEKKYLQSALNEIKYFYNYQIKEKYLSSFSVAMHNNIIKFKDENKFPQIAYGIRPMIAAASAAYNITGDSSYASTAARLAAWFFGDNPAGRKIYNTSTGLCFDGIESSEKINMNSGAESTIEALLSMLAVESNPQIKKRLKNFVIPAKSARED
jgi:DUF1680 family protein